MKLGVGSIVFLVTLAAISLHVMNELSEEASAYTPHDPISIYENAYFNAAHGVVGGSGTPSDPYIIEGWEINASSKTGIFMMNTDANFIIRNVYIHSDTYSNNGIYLRRVANGRIENATIVGNDDAIFIMDISNNITVTDCNVSSNKGGIYASASASISVVGNHVSLNEGTGISLSSIAFTVIDNNVSSNYGGIHVSSSVNGTIKNNDVVSSDDGIVVSSSVNASVIDNFISEGGVNAEKSHNITIENNTILQTRYGIELDRSTDIILRNNTMIETGIHIWDDFPEHWNTHTIDSTNTVNNKPVYYWKNVDGGTIPLGAGEVILANCTNVKVENQQMSDGTAGILVGYSSRITVANNSLFDRKYGVFLSHTDNTTVVGNNASHNRDGILLGYSDGNTISDNTVSGNYQAIRLEHSEKNAIVRNSVWNNSNGVRLGQASHNNSVYHNSLNNPRQAVDVAKFNSWDNGYPSGGNYWNDYIRIDEMSGPDQNQTGSDGIGDSPYENIVQGDSPDRYPLMNPIVPVPNLPPSLNISDPTPGTVLSGVFRFRGVVSDPDGRVVRVEVKIDDGEWMTAIEWNTTTETGVRGWWYDWGTTTVQNGEYAFYARSYDGAAYSDVAGVTVIVSNVAHEKPVFDEAWFWIGVVILVVAVLAVLLLIGRKRKRLKGGRHPESDSSEEM